MVQPKIKTEDFLLLKTKNCETLIKRTHRKTEETLDSSESNQEKLFQLNNQSRI